MLNQEQKVLAQILSDYRHNILVRACAGSGKTRLLASKYLATLLLRGTPKGIAAITFTEKAAQELKARIQSFLRRIAQSSSEKELELSSDLPWLELSEGLLKHSHPHAPKFSQDKLWQELKARSAQLSKAIVGSGAPIGTIHAFAMKTLEAYPLEALGGFLTRFDPSGKRLEGMLEDFSSEGVLGASEKIHWASYNQLNRLLSEILELLKRGFAQNGGSPQASRRGDMRFDASSPYAKTIESLWPEFLQLASGSIVKSREEGYLDYDLLLYWLHQFLTQAQEPLLSELRERAQYILLDELQDTDPLQMEILSRLGRLDEKEAKGGRIFMVGDPFQSIYGFRGACPELIFEKRKELFKEFNLSGNKRSGKRILYFVNNAFQGAAPNYQPMESAPLYERKVDQILWHSPGEDTEDFRLNEARHAAAAVAELARKHKWQWRHFAILLRKMTHGWIYLEELRRLGIPAVLSTSDNGILKRSLSVRVLYWLLESMRNPHNANADAFFSHLSFFKTPDWKERLSRLRAQHFETASAAALVGGVKEEFQLAAFAIEGGAEEIQALNLAENVAWRQESDIASFLNYLQAKFENKEEDEDAGEPEVPWEGDCVRIATIHKVKGLQFPCVLLAGLSDWSLKNDGKKVLWDPVENRAAVSFQEPGKDKFLGSDLESFKALKEAAKKSNSAENERLLYVAVTRPEEMLVIFEPPEARASKSPSLSILKRAKNEAQQYQCPCCKGETLLSLSLPGRGQGEGKKQTEDSPHPNPLPASGARAQISPALLYASEKTPLDEQEPGQVPILPKNKDEHYLQSLGRILHGTLEHIPWKEKPVQKEIAEALEKSSALEAAFSGTPAKALMSEAKETALAFFASPLWREISSKKLLEREFPVAYLKDESLVVGRVDLMYEDGKTLVIADYKTEAASGAAFKNQGAHYLESLKGYAQRMGYTQTRFEVISLKGAKRY